MASLPQSAALDAGLKPLIEDFLTQCDWVKFAQGDPGRTECERLHQMASRLIDETGVGLPSRKQATERKGGMNFRFESPWWFLALLVLPLLEWCRRRTAREAVFVYSSLTLVKGILQMNRTLASRVLLAARWMGLVLLIVGMARPSGLWVRLPARPAASTSPSRWTCRCLCSVKTSNCRGASRSGHRGQGHPQGVYREPPE